MSSVRVIKIYEQLKENFKNLGYPKPSYSVQGITTDTTFNGAQCVIYDFTSATWATGNYRFAIMAFPCGYGESDSVKTQSHAAGQFIDGSVRFGLIYEANVALSHTSTAAVMAFDKFVMDTMHIIHGQMQAPVDVYITDNTVEPVLKGINGAAASSANITKIATLLPYGRTYAGGI